MDQSSKQLTNLIFAVEQEAKALDHNNNSNNTNNSDTQQDTHTLDNLLLQLQCMLRAESSLSHQFQPQLNHIALQSLLHRPSSSSSSSSQLFRAENFIHQDLSSKLSSCIALKPFLDPPLSRHILLTPKPLPQQQPLPLQQQQNQNQPLRGFKVPKPVPDTNINNNNNNNGVTNSFYMDNDEDIISIGDHNAPPPPLINNNKRYLPPSSNHNHTLNNQAPPPPPPPQHQPTSAWANNNNNKVPRKDQDQDVHHNRRHTSSTGNNEDVVVDMTGVVEEQNEDGTGRNNPFTTAKNRLMVEMQKKGQTVPPSMTARANASGLRRNVSSGGGGNNNNNNNNTTTGANGKFIPPFVRKALAGGPNNNNNNNNNQAAYNDNNNGNGGGGDQEPPFTARTMDLLKLVPGDPVPEELSKLDAVLVETICNEVIGSGEAASVTWDDIAGQEAAKALIAEVVIWPMLNPDIFTGARAPPKGVLLFGPPGTGKTLLGKAIASNINAAFFSISASSLTSKWIGEGEKLVRTLFAVAAWISPSVIFIDEVDSLLSARKSEGEHESSRRLKTELLVQMEGCDPTVQGRRVLLIGATNRPEELDDAARRRMPKQLYIPLPCDAARKQMVLRALGPGAKVAAALSEEDLGKIVMKTDGYSGSDMRNLIQEACQGPVRDAVRQHGAGVANLKEGDLRPVVLKDFAAAAKVQKASVQTEEVKRYAEYNERHGARLDNDRGGDDDDSLMEDW